MMSRRAKEEIISESEYITTETAGSYGVLPMQILAPMEVITEKLRRKGILLPTKARPTTLTSMLSSSDEAIVSYFSSPAYGPLRYYRCCDNSHKVRRLVDYQVRWSALFTPASKHRCNTAKVIVECTEGPRGLNGKGEVIAKFPGSPTIARMGKGLLTNIRRDAVDDILRSTTIRLTPSNLFPKSWCAVFGRANDDIEMHLIFGGKVWTVENSERTKPRRQKDHWSGRYTFGTESQTDTTISQTPRGIYNDPPG